MIVFGQNKTHFSSTDVPKTFQMVLKYGFAAAVFFYEKAGYRFLVVWCPQFVLERAV